MADPDPQFDAWRDSLPATHWARYDISACRLGWDASRKHGAGGYLVWSNEHNAWWRADSAGYSRSILGAGLYTREEAISIAAHCRDGWVVDRRPDEIPVAVADLPEQVAALILAAQAKPSHEGDAA